MYDSFPHLVQSIPDAGGSIIPVSQDTQGIFILFDLPDSSESSPLCCNVNTSDPGEKGEVCNVIHSTPPFAQNPRRSTRSQFTNGICQSEVTKTLLSFIVIGLRCSSIIRAYIPLRDGSALICRTRSRTCSRWFCSHNLARAISFARFSGLASYFLLAARFRSCFSLSPRITLDSSNLPQNLIVVPDDSLLAQVIYHSLG